ncbi:MAG: transporter [Cyanobacteria bacterium QS_8_64_29]|nr:MAG: transporter [Cyanobacteria bacterium QS_8_64_29]
MPAISRVLKASIAAAIAAGSSTAAMAQPALPESQESAPEPPKVPTFELPPALIPPPQERSQESLREIEPSPNPLQRPNRPQQAQVEMVRALSLEQALQLARRNNPQLEQARQELAAARDSLQAAQAERFPELTTRVTLDTAKRATSEIRAQEQSFQLEPDELNTALNGELQLSYDIYTGERRSAQIEQAEQRVRLRQLQLEQQREAVALKVKERYYSLQEATSQVAIAQAAINESRQSLRDAQLRKRAGVGTQFDVLQAQTELSQDRQELANARAQQRIARRRLAQTLNLAPQASVTAQDPVEKAGTWQQSLEASITQALRNRSELEQQIAQRRISQQEAQVALAGIRPQVSAFGSYNIRKEFNNVGPGDGFRLGVQMQWTAFDGGRARSQAQQAREQAETAEARFANQRNQIRLAVEESFFNLQANQQNIQTAKAEVRQAEEALRLARLRFQAGVGTQTDVINAQARLTRARENRLTAIINYNTSLARLQRRTSSFPQDDPFAAP